MKHLPNIPSLDKPIIAMTPPSCSSIKRRSLAKFVANKIPSIEVLKRIVMSSLQSRCGVREVLRRIILEPSSEIDSEAKSN